MSRDCVRVAESGVPLDFRQDLCLCSINQSGCYSHGRMQTPHELAFHDCFAFFRLRVNSFQSVQPAWRQALGLVGWLALAFAAAAIGAVASANAGAFYAELARPAWAPPGWLFAPVWSTLYTLMGISAWLVWRARGFEGARSALSVFIAQLGVNALWSWLFFVWHRGGLAFVDAVLLCCLIGATIVLFRRISTLASLLLLPYLAWVAFASVLTLSVWRLNPGVLS